MFLLILCFNILVQITGAPAVEVKVATEAPETHGQGEQEEQDQEQEEDDGETETETAAWEGGGEEVCSGDAESASDGE